MLGRHFISKLQQLQTEQPHVWTLYVDDSSNDKGRKQIVRLGYLVDRIVYNFLNTIYVGFFVSDIVHHNNHTIKTFIQTILSVINYKVL